jgi:P63C domain
MLATASTKCIMLASASRMIRMIDPKKGGEARARSLSTEDRIRIARAGAQARWAKADPSRGTLRRAVCGSQDEPVNVGGIEIPCYVLDDETRLLTVGGVSDGIGLARGGSMIAGMNRLELFISRNRIKPYVSNELAERIHSPIIFITPTGNKAYGYNAEILVELCEIILRARQDNVLQSQQMRIAQQCELLMRGLARLGIIGLVDEATGYQYVRARNALERLLDKWLTKELQPWKRQFPNDYYQRIFELNGWTYDPESLARPGVIGHWTNDLIYERLGPGLREQLHEYSGRDAKGRLKHQLHRFFTSSYGIPELQSHLAAIVALMKAAKNWDQFKELVQRVFPKPETTLSMAFDDLEQIRPKRQPKA